MACWISMANWAPGLRNEFVLESPARNRLPQAHRPESAAMTGIRAFMNTSLHNGRIVLAMMLLSWSSSSWAPLIPVSCLKKLNCERKCEARAAICAGRAAKGCYNDSSGGQPTSGLCDTYKSTCKAQKTACDAVCDAIPPGCGPMGNQPEDKEPDEEEEDDAPADPPPDYGPPPIPGWPPAGGNTSTNITSICVGDGACSMGDPHLRSFDRARFDFQGAGEYHFARSDENDIDIQVRYTPYRDSRRISVTTALAARSGGVRVTVVAGRDTLIEINGEPVSLKSGLANTLLHDSGVVLVRQNRSYRIKMPLGVVIKVGDMGNHISLDVDSQEYPLAGLGGSNDGNYENDFTVRDGATLPLTAGRLNYDQLYRQFGDSWRVAQEDSLFDYADGENTGTYSDPAFPDKHLDIEDLGTEARQHAESICREAGVKPGPAFENCVYDLGFTNDASFTQSYIEQPARPAATLDAPATAAAGSTVVVQWSGPANDRDYIALAAADQSASQYSSTGKLDETGQVRLRVPGIPGDYELRYVVNEDRQIIASIPLKVTAVTATLEAPATAAAGSTVIVQWSGPANGRDYIALATADQSASQYSAASKLDETGQVRLRVPGIPGDYELRYVVNEDRQIIASIPLKVTAVTATLDAPARAAAGSTVVVQWSGPANDRDYIALTTADQSASQYSAASKLDETGTVSLQAPTEPGDYVLRYVTDVDRQIIAEVPITIE
ncbi:MAG TPA: hypothetical protein ENK49_08205 [Gammaproteobacteria bacterium]|nr:hypothetical protein [Gammaproteobacteria bacterium]